MAKPLSLNSTEILLLHGLTTYLKKNNLRDMTIQDILDISEVSRRTFYKYFKNKTDFINYIEDMLINELEEKLTEDRKILISKLPDQPAAKDILNLSEPAFRKTLEFCMTYKNIAQALLSDHGDIRFAHEIERISEQEFMRRVKYLSGLDSQLDNPLIIKIYVTQIITLIESWLLYSDSISPKEIRRLIGRVQVTPPFEILQAILADNDNNQKA